MMKRQWLKVAIVALLVAGGAAPGRAQNPGVARDTARADVLRQHGSLPEAEEIYRQVLAVEPTWLPANFGLAQTLEAAGKLPEAIAAYQAVLKLDPQHPETLNRLSRLLFDAHRYEDAAPVYATIYRLDPTAANQELLARIYFQAEKYTEALPLFKALAEANPDQLELNLQYQKCQLLAEQMAARELYRKGEAALAAGRPAEALEFFKQAQAAKDPPADLEQKMARAERGVALQEGDAAARGIALDGDTVAADRVLAQLDELEKRGPEFFDDKLLKLRVGLLLARARFALKHELTAAAYDDLWLLEKIIDRNVTAVARPEQLEVYFQLGQISFVQQEYDRALRYYQMVKNQDPGYPEIDDRIEAVKFRRGLWRQVVVWSLLLAGAVALALTRRRWYPALKVRYHLYTGRQAFVEEDWPRARYHYEEAARLRQPTPGAVLARLTAIYQKLKMKAEANQSASAAVAGGGADWETVLTLLRRHIEDRDEAAARQRFAQAEQLATSDAQRQELKRLRLEFAEAQGKWADAARAHQDLFSGAPDDAGRSRKQLDLWVKAGDLEQAVPALTGYLARHPVDWEWGLAGLRELQTRYPDSLRVILALGELLAAHGRNREAIAAYELAVQRVPQKENLLRRLVPLHEQEQDWAAVVSTLQALLAISRPEPGQLLLAARACQHLQRYPEAIDYFFQTLQLEQDNVEAFRQLLETGRFYADRDDHETAIGIYRRLLELTFFDNVEVHYELGKSLFARGDYEPAITQLQQVRRGNALLRHQAKNLIALCLLQRGQHDLARAQLDEIPIDTAGFDAELRKAVLYNRARVAEAQSDTPGAIAAYQKVLLADINYQDAAARFHALQGGRA